MPALESRLLRSQPRTATGPPASGSRRNRSATRENSLMAGFLEKGAENTQWPGRLPRAQGSEGGCALLLQRLELDAVAALIDIEARL
jgi:hypothetical protein